MPSLGKIEPGAGTIREDFGSASANRCRRETEATSDGNPHVPGTTTNYTGLEALIFTSSLQPQETLEVT